MPSEEYHAMFWAPTATTPGPPVVTALANGASRKTGSSGTRVQVRPSSEVQTAARVGPAACSPAILADSLSLVPTATRPGPPVVTSLIVPGPSPSPGTRVHV